MSYSQSNLPPVLDDPQELLDSEIILRPLSRVPGHFTLRRNYVQNVAYFDPDAKPLGTPDTEYAEAFLVERLIDRHEENLVYFHELFATVPDPWDDDGGVIISTPQISGAGVMGAAKSITGWARVPGSLTLRRLTSAAHGFSANDRVRVEGTLTTTKTVAGIPRVTAQVVAADYKIATAVTNTFDIPFGGLAEAASYSFTGSAYKYTSGLPSRPANSLALPARVHREYFFKGITPGIVTEQDIPKVQVFRPVLDSSGVLSTTSTPTASTYLGWIDNAYELVSESAPEPYLGPLVALRTVFYTPQ